MSYILIISEKPQAAQKIADALGTAKKFREKDVNYYQVTTKDKQNVIVASAVGHLFILGEKGGESWKYPVFDTEWMPIYKKSKAGKYTKGYCDLLKKLGKEATEFVVASDFDIEGEVIGYNVLKQIFKVENGSRMKFSSLTKDSILKAFENRAKTIEIGQKEAGLTRHNLDWFYGINLSRAFTQAIKVGANRFKVMSTGRVQAPTLHFLCNKEKEISKFIPETYYEIYLNGKIKNEKIRAQYFLNKTTQIKKEEIDEKDENSKLKKDKYKLTNEKQVKKIVEETTNQNGIVSEITSRKFKQPVPTPFDLTSLQMEASNLFGISPKRCLEIAQNLYSNGWTSYPRTSSQKFKDTDLKAILTKLEKFLNYKKLVEKVYQVNKSLKPKEGKKDDPAHPSIMPTGELPKKLEGQEEKIYDLIVKRFLSVFGIDAIKETNKIIIDINSHNFEMKATRIIEENWIELYKPYNRSENLELPKVEKNEKVENKKIEDLKKETNPPNRFTDASIIKELEKRNLGTKATRAEILNRLRENGYVIDKSIKVTDLGIKMDEVVSTELPQITDENLTRGFEKEMEEIREQKTTREKVLNSAKAKLEIILKDIKSKEKELGKKLSEASKTSEFEKNKIRKCLKCEKGWLCVKTAHKTKSKFLGCSAYPDCKEIFSLPKVAFLKPLKEEDSDTENKELIYIMAGSSLRNIKKILVNVDKKEKEKQLKKDSKKYKEVGTTCPKCNKGIFVLRKSYYGGEFLGCNNYPKCKTLVPIEKGEVKMDKIKSS